MFNRGIAPGAVLSAVSMLALAGAGCATKKHVREAIAPVQNRVSDVEKKTAENTTAIGDLDRNVSRADERAMEADRKAVAAGQAASKANDLAMQAGQKADGANTLAQQSMSKADSVQQNLARTVDNLDNYKMVSTEKLLFKVNHSELDKDAKAKLDTFAEGLSSVKNYIIEVEGFTDRTGNKALNLELSRRRAEAVVRYLTVSKNVPLRKIHDMGVGAEDPNADNKTREARRENRRVDLRLYSLDMNGVMAAPSSPGTN